jgi:hypothetical protein
MIPIPIIATIVIVLYILSSIKILREYERGVIFRLGRLLADAKGPGIILVFAPVDRSSRRLRCAQSSARWSWTNCWPGGKRSTYACRAFSTRIRRPGV